MTPFRRIPSTHAAAALGFADWSTPLATYLSCHDERAWDENPEEPQRGVRLKPALRNWVGATLERRFFAPPRVEVMGSQQSPRTACLSARPDGVSGDGTTVLLLKAPVDSARWLLPLAEHEEEGDNSLGTRLALPTDVRIECAVLDAVMKPRDIVVGVMIGGKLHTLPYEPPHPDFGAKVVMVLAGFWKTYVERSTAPRALKGDETTLRKLFPKPTTSSERRFDSCTEEEKSAILAWAAAQRQRTAAQKIEKDTRPMVVQAIAEHSGMVGFPAGSGIATVSFDSREPGPNNGTWNAIAHELLAKLSPRAQKRLLEKHTPTVGTRVLRPFFEKAAVAA